MLAITDRAVQVLLDHRAGRGLIVSCYAGPALTDDFRSLWSQHLKGQAAEIERRLGDGPQARFGTNIELIRDALGTLTARRARGMAVFSAAEQNLFYAFPLGVPMADRLVLDEMPYLVPLLEAMHRQRRYLGVLTDSHRSRLYETAWGHSRLLREMEENVPRGQRSAAQMWSKHRYRKRLAAAIDRAWRAAPFHGLILLGDDETLRTVHASLPPLVRRQIVHTEPYSWSPDNPTVDAAVQEVLDGAVRAHDGRLEAELERRLHARELIAAGPQEVVDALRNGQGGLSGVPDPGAGSRRDRHAVSGVWSPVHRDARPVRLLPGPMRHRESLAGGSGFCRAAQHHGPHRRAASRTLAPWRHRGGVVAGRAVGSRREQDGQSVTTRRALETGDD